MEIKFIKYTKKTKLLHFTVDGQPTRLLIDTAPMIPRLTPYHTDGGLGEQVIKYINTSIGERVDVPYEGSSVFVPALLASFARIIKLSGPMSKTRWQSILSIDRNARGIYRGPNSIINLTHYVYRDRDDETDERHFVTLTTNRCQLTITDRSEIFINMNGEVPVDGDLVEYSRQAYEFLCYVKSGHLWLPPLVSPESIYSSVDLQSGLIEYRSGKETSQDSEYARDILEFGKLIRDNFNLPTPQHPQMFTSPVPDKKLSVEEIFSTAVKIKNHLPWEVLRCDSAMKYGDHYYFVHVGLPYEGAEEGIVVRLEMVECGRSRRRSNKDIEPPLAIFYNDYGITTEVGKHVEVIDFTGMNKDAFEKHLNRACR